MRGQRPAGIAPNNVQAKTPVQENGMKVALPRVTMSAWRTMGPPAWSGWLSGQSGLRRMPGARLEPNLTRSKLVRSFSLNWPKNVAHPDIVLHRLRHLIPTFIHRQASLQKAHG